MGKRLLPSGATVQVPDGLTRGGEIDFLRQQGATNEQLGIVPEVPDPGGRATQFLIGLQHFAAERGLERGDIDRSIPPPDTLATLAGQVAVPVAAGVAAGFIPGAQAGIPAIIAQGLVAAGLEGTREGATIGSTLQAGGLGAGGQFVGATLARAGSGALTSIAARRARQPIGLGEGVAGTMLQGAARLGQGVGSLNTAVKTNIKAINFQVAKALGFTDDFARNVDDVGEEFLLASRGNVNRVYGQAAPTEAVKISKAMAFLDEIPEGASPAINDLKAALLEFGDAIPPERWQPIQRSLRDASNELRKNTNWGQWATRSEQAIDALDEAAGAAGGNRALLGQANQQFKLLATLEEINAVVEEGVLPAGELLRKLGRENFKGFGRRTIAEGSENVLPEISKLIDTAKTIAKFTRQTAGGSATAGRQLTFGAGIGAMGVSAFSPLTSAAMLGVAVTPRIGGLAALGSPGALTRLGALGQVLPELILGDDEDL